MTADRPTHAELFCPVCLGHLVIAAETLDRHGEPTMAPAVCPVCRPRPSSREVWLAAVNVAKRLAAEAQR
jgi:hypothetical protein